MIEDLVTSTNHSKPLHLTTFNLSNISLLISAVSMNISIVEGKQSSTISMLNFNRIFKFQHTRTQEHELWKTSRNWNEYSIELLAHKKMDG